MSEPPSGRWTGRSRSVSAAAAVFAGILAIARFLLPTYDRYDWPIQVVAGARMAHERPYLDVHVLYGPLGHEVLAWFVAASGADPALVARCYFAAIALVGLALVWLLTRSMAGSSGSDRPAQAALLLAAPMALMASYSGLALDLLLVGLLVARATIDEPRSAPAWAALCGVITVVLVLVRVNFGLYFAATCGAALAWAGLRERRWKPLAALVAAITLAGALAALAMWHGGYLDQYLHDTLQYIQRFGSRTLPIGAAMERPLTGISFVGLAFLAGGLGLPRRPVLERVLLGMLLATLASYAALRPDLVHLSPLVVVLVPLLVAVSPRSTRERQLRLAGLGFGLLFAVTLLRPTLGGLIRLAVPDRNRTTVAGFALDAGAARLVRDLKARGTRTGDVLIASWPGSCECVSHWCANVSVYPAGGWLPPTRVWIPDTAVSSWADAQRSMIDDLQARGTRFVAFEAMRSPGCPDRRVVDPGLLANWVQAHYRLTETVREPGAPTEWYLYEKEP